MSKYTTQLRYICENKAGLTSSVGLGSIDDVINKSWNKIFTTPVDFFDPSYREPLCKKIIRHYYMHEIGQETVALFLFYLNTTMAEIMPYYNQLYESARLQFDPFHDVDLETTTEARNQGNEKTKDDKTSSYTRTDDLQRTEHLSSDSTRTDDLSQTTGNSSLDIFHDTPQGSLLQLDDHTYMTNARKITDNGNVSNTGTQKVVDTGDNTVENTGTQRNEGQEGMTGNRDFSSTNDVTEHVRGKRGGQSYSSLLKEYRETMLNIDMMVIDEFASCFMQLW